MRRSAKLGMIVSACALPWPAAAYDGQVVGRIAYITVVEDSPGRTTIELEGSPALCGPSSSAITASIAVTANNYDAIVSGLLTAYSLQRRVQVFTNLINGSCIIERIQLWPN